jgi:hypothetical protein
MTLANTSKKVLTRTILTLAALGAFASVAPDAEAQEVVTPTAKGVVGGALLGGEVVMITEAIIGVRPVWPYLAFGGLGAVGGGVAGYFIEQSSSDGRVPLFMLAGGIALVIPTMVLTLNATRYRSPAEDNLESKAPTNEPKADPGKLDGSPVQGAPGTNAPSPTPAPATPPAGGGGAPLSLFNLRNGEVRLTIPVPEVRPVFSAVERSKFGLRNETEVRVPVVNVTF